MYLSKKVTPNNILFQNMKLKMYGEKKSRKNLDNLNICNNKKNIINVIFFYNVVLQ